MLCLSVQSVTRNARCRCRIPNTTMNLTCLPSIGSLCGLKSDTVGIHVSRNANLTRQHEPDVVPAASSSASACKLDAVLRVYINRRVSSYIVKASGRLSLSDLEAAFIMMHTILNCLVILSLQRKPKSKTPVLPPPSPLPEPKSPETTSKDAHPPRPVS